MPGFVRFSIWKPPEITLRQQMARFPENKGKRLACRVLTPLGRILKAVQVVGKTPEEIKAAAIEVDTRKLASLSFLIPEISIRQQLGNFEGNRYRRVPFSLRTILGHPVRVEEALGLSLFDLEDLFVRVDMFRSDSSNNSVFGPIYFRRRSLAT